MKLLSILAVAGLASGATLKVKRDDINASGEVILPALSPSSKLVIDEKTTVVAEGVEDGTNVTLFKFPDGQYYSLEFAQGPRVEGLTVGADGVCAGCRSDAGDTITTRDLSAAELAERDGLEGADLERRFFLLHLIGSAIKFKLSLFTGIKKALLYGCFKDYSRPVHIYRPHGHGGQCDVGRNGYIHWPNVHIGCSNGIGGVYVGCSVQGTQLWRWTDGSICPIHVRRGRCRVGWSPYRSNHGGQWWWKRDQIEGAQ